MRSLPRPSRSSRDVLAACLSRMRNSPRRTQFSALADAFEAADVAYIRHGETSALFQMQAVETAPLGRDDLLFLFESMRRQGTPARDIYDELRSNNWRGLCPLCSQGVPESLDHYLEKAIHFGLAVTPLNLISSCMRCNHARSIANVEQAEEQTLHPYFDQCDDERWLSCDVLETDPISLTFRAAPPETWPELKRARVSNHFEVLKLGVLYATHGAVELTGKRALFDNLAVAESAAGLTRHLLSEANARLQSERNSWQGALYFGLSASEWFCAGGYRNIPEPMR